MKKALLIAGKVIVTALVFWWVIHKLGPGGLGHLWDSARAARPLGLCAGLVMYFFAMGLGIYRWKCLLRVQGIHVTVYQAVWITAVGMFFNAFLIGATGGDVLKAWYAAKTTPHKKPHAVLSVAVDRFIGLIGLFLVATVSVLLNWRVLMDHEETRPLAMLVIGILAGSVVAVALIAQRRRLTSQPWWGKISCYIPARQLMSRLSESYDMYGRHPRVVALALFLSLGVHASAVMTAWLIGGAMGIQGVELKHYFVYCPLINAFAAIPVTIGGLGLREGAFKFFFSMQGVPDPQAVALSLLFYATTLVVSLTSGVLFLVGKPKSFSGTPPST